MKLDSINPLPQPINWCRVEFKFNSGNEIAFDYFYLQQFTLPQLHDAIRSNACHYHEHWYGIFRELKHHAKCCMIEECGISFRCRMGMLHIEMKSFICQEGLRDENLFPLNDDYVASFDQSEAEDYDKLSSGVS